MPFRTTLRSFYGRRCLLLLLFLLLTVGAASGTSDWPGFRGPQGNGQATGGLPEGAGDLRLSVRWQRGIGSGYSGIALVGDLAVTASSDGERDHVLAFDPATGVARWTADLGPMTVGMGGSKDGPISTPTIAGGRVFMVSTLGLLVALDAESGARLWSVHLVDDLGSRRPIYGFSTSPVVAGDIVVVQAGGDEGALVGLDVGTGAVRWRTFRDAHYAQSPIVTQLAGRQQIVTMGSLRVVGVDPETGAELWSHAHGGVGEFGAESQTPLPLGGDRLFVKHDNERSVVLRVLVREDESLGAEVVHESRTMTRSYSPPTVWDGRVYGYTSRFLSALDTRSGEELWRSRAPGDGFPTAVDGHLLVLSKNDGTAHLGVASPQGWSELDRVELFDDLVWTPPSYRDGAFFVRSLTELARVDLVRTTATTDQGAGDLPAELDAIRAAVERGEGAEAAVDALLRGLDGPLADGDRALFLWRGDAEEVGIAGDMFGFRYDEPMQRLEGTDLFWWEGRLDRRGRFSYVYFPDYEPALDPLNPRTVEATGQGPDLNHRADEALQMSWFSMPEWPGSALDEGATPPSRGQIDRFELQVEVPPPRGGSGGPSTVTVPVSVWLPPGYDASGDRYPVVYALERYAEPIGDWPATLDAVVGRATAPLIAVMIDAPEGFYGRRGGGRVGLLVPSVVEAVDARYRTLADPEQRAAVGALYTAPPALALSLGADRLFGRVALQSPFVLDATMPIHVRQIEANAEGPRPSRFYFEWARWEMRSRGEGLDLGDSMAELFALFADNGYEPVGGEVWDSTDWAGWRNRTGLVLEFLFPREGGGPPRGLEPWLVTEE